MDRPKATEKQQRAYKYLLKNKYSILAMDPRLGKSRVIIALRNKLKLNCLVVCPGYLVPNWKKEIEKWGSPDNQITLFRKGKDIYPVCDTDFVIVSYGLAQKAEHLFEWADMVVLDEAHHLKSMEAKVTQFIHKNIYENSIERVHPMTGTIIKNRVKEFYSPLALMHYNPHTAGGQFLDSYPDELTFADDFSYRTSFKMEINGKYITVVKWDGLRNIDKLKSHLKGKYIRIRAEAGDLPEINTTTINVSDVDDKDLLDSFNSYFDGDGTGSVNPTFKSEAALRKVPFTIKYVEDLMQNVECVLVYSDHVLAAEAIAKHFNVQAITGKVSGSKRSEMAAEFQAGKRNMLVATIGSLKEGQDLFRAKDIVLNDPTWVPGDLFQVLNRIRGIGQQGTRTFHRIVGSPQDEYIWDVIQKKMDVIRRAT